jgi:hypothetical protein
MQPTELPKVNREREQAGHAGFDASKHCYETGHDVAIYKDNLGDVDWYCLHSGCESSAD